MNRHCFDEALKRSDPVILGDDSARFFYGFTLERISELLSGKKAANDREQDLQRQLLDDSTLPPILGVK